MTPTLLQVLGKGPTQSQRSTPQHRVVDLPRSGLRETGRDHALPVTEDRRQAPLQEDP